MRLSIVLLFVVVHVVVGYPYQTFSPTSEIYSSNGLSLGYIRYIDGNGVQRLVEYTYPKPTYNELRLSYESQRHTENPFLKNSLQTIYTGPEYIYQGSNDDQIAREQHFRAWNLQRYNALKNEADKLYAEGKVPSSDMLTRLQQFQEYSTNDQFARDEHLKLWNEARLNFLNSQARVNKENQQARNAHLRLYDEQVQLIHGYENDLAKAQQKVEDLDQRNKEHSRLLKEANVHSVESNQQNSGISPTQAAEHFKSSESLAFKSTETHQTGASIGQTFEDSILVETPEVQRAKEEHLRLWNIAKLRAEKADQYKSGSDATQVAQNVDSSHFLTLKFAEPQQAGILTKIVSEPSQNKIQAFQGKLLVETPEVQLAREEHLRVWNEAKLRGEETDKSQSAEQSHVISTPALKTASETSLNQVIGTIFQQQEQKDQFNTKDVQMSMQTLGMSNQQLIENDSMALQEKIEQEAEQLREMERLREDEKMRELDALKEAERLKEEKKQMIAEQMLIKNIDEARLQKDLKEQFDGERVRKVSTEIVTQPGIYFLENRYQNPFVYQYNTPAAAVRFASGQPQYLRYPGAQAYTLHTSGQQQQLQLQPSFVYNEKPATVKYVSQEYLPAGISSEQVHQTKEAKDLYELEKATREHFHAHEIALKQLDFANQKASGADCIH